MNEEEKRALEKILGLDFPPSEQEGLIRDHPDLPAAARVLEKHLSAYESQGTPPMSPDFTAKVMARLARPSRVETVRAYFRGWRRLTLAGSFVAAVAAGLIFGPKLFFREGPGVTVSEESVSGKKVYRVRFALNRPGAKSVELAGDFNHWNPVPVAASGDGNFTIEWTLEEGTYTYAFLVDGKQWMPDPSVSRQVADGFGNVNSLINL